MRHHMHESGVQFAHHRWLTANDLIMKTCRLGGAAVPPITALTLPQPDRLNGGGLPGGG